MPHAATGTLRMDATDHGALGTYREWAPPAALASVVACAWEVQAGAPGGSVPPDNCADVLVHLAPDRSVLAVRAVGVMTQPITVPATDVRVVGVRFRPGWWRATLGMPARMLRDDARPLADVHRRVARALSGGVPHAMTPTQWMLDALARAVTDAPPAAVRTALAAIARTGGRATVPQLAREAGVSRQHLGRLFDEWVGVGPKFASRVARVEHAFDARASTPGGGWSQIAAACGFADQAHLIREARALRGATPGEWVMHD
ncbi:MAG: AraC family transcriptional regulator [Gemmatimonadaceae bacterium]|jgi:AraC-like DNA-binding protein|nr:AraC family transcriptional regulator [Gemmatimonadaceae bacterium]